MMPDYGHEAADKGLKQLEKDLKSLYLNAAVDMQEKARDFMRDFERKDEQMRALVSQGKWTEEQYDTWRRNQMMTEKRMQDMTDQLAKDLANTDKIAAGMINNTLPSAYAENYNFGTYEIETGTTINTSFTLYDKKTVENLMKADPKIIPQARVNIPEDERWNRQKLTSAIAQGILQGESIPKIANRLQGVAAMDRNAAIRNARTYTTAAENKGRVDSIARANDMGIPADQEWLATLDDRTRMEHRHLDGQVRPVGEPFEADGYRIMYPGDPDAEPEMIYNCRCTLVSRVRGRIYNDERNDSKLDGMSYDEWKHAKDSRIDPKEEPKEEEKKKPEDYTIKEIMEKVEQMPGNEYGDKENLLPLTNENGDYPATKFYNTIPEEKAAELETEATVKIADLYTEQDEIFMNRMEYLAESFDGQKISGLPTEEHDTGITVAKYDDKLVVIDGNNRANLAILKGQEELDVVFIDLDKYRAENETAGTQKEEPARTIAEGKDLTGTWERRPDQFAFEIDDVLNAQGFDGLPHVVTPEEFDKAVKEANGGQGFIAQRTYSAPDQETLEAYREALYNGKWYVDCSTGGAKWGQGMYTAGNYEGQLTDEIKQEMKDYQNVNEAYTSHRLSDEERLQFAIDNLPEELKGNDDVINYLKYADNASGDFSIKESNKYYYKLQEEIGSENLRQVDRAIASIPVNNTPPNYTETMTMDPSAKIIGYRELAEQKEEYINQIEKKYNAYDKEERKEELEKKWIQENVSDEKVSRLMLANYHISGEDIKDVMQESNEKDIQKAKLLSNAMRANVQKTTDAESNKMKDEVHEARTMNIGSFAALKGYDAIKTDAGTSGHDTIILNRTKLIIKGG